MAIPRIAITTGEPAGIGPDITIMAAQQDWNAQLVAIGSVELLRERADALNLPLSITPFDEAIPAQAHRAAELHVLPVEVQEPVQAGTLNPRNANYVLNTLRQAASGCTNGTFSAMVTAPVQKSVINDAGIPFSGHTEFLAEKTDTPRVVMMLTSGEMRVALATTHLPLAAVPAAITPELLTDTLTILHHDLITRFGLPNPRIAVLGLNPHAGEGGHLGLEEINVINPTIKRLREQTLNLTDPLPADTAFNPKVLDTVDAVFAMYHDQGLPVLKYAGFGNAVNVTLGLPIVRTSVDHGTALDLAGTGNVDSGSLTAAIELAITLS
ncbi:4-hydroxythreonine-4-phosphate dehydrogenase PdxA [Marinobacter alexandrii]|uniref:4-hydroxythreonine-4-phosphate dehydrogenase PdxA n=1 Tax=Marinobacter alexandrii TaxID=2570351 RepID=UPI0032996187